MAKKKSTVEEGAVVEPSEPEVVEEEVVEETTPDPVAEEVADEVVEEVKVTSDAEVTKIKYLLKGPIATVDGGLLYEGQTGNVVSHMADAMVGRGHAEYV